MSLTSTLFRMTPENQDRALRQLARKKIDEGMDQQAFDSWTHREILHALHAAGRPQAEYSSYRRRIRYAFNSELQNRPFQAFVDHQGGDSPKAGNV